MQSKDERLAFGQARYGSLKNDKVHFKCDHCDTDFTKNMEMNKGGRLPKETVRCPQCGSAFTSVA